MLDDLIKHKNCFKSVNFADIELRFSVVVVEIILQHTIQALLAHEINLFKTLAVTCNTFRSSNFIAWRSHATFNKVSCFIC